MKTMMMKQMRMRMCCCCCSMQMMRNDKERSNQHIINIYKERQEHEKISIHHSIALRAAS
jgi:hypothetical protein